MLETPNHRLRSRITGPIVSNMPRNKVFFPVDEEQGPARRPPAISWTSAQGTDGSAHSQGIGYKEVMLPIIPCYGIPSVRYVRGTAGMAKSQDGDHPLHDHHLHPQCPDPAMEDCVRSGKQA